MYAMPPSCTSGFASAVAFAALSRGNGSLHGQLGLEIL